MNIYNLLKKFQYIFLNYFFIFFENSLKKLLPNKTLFSWHLLHQHMPWFRYNVIGDTKKGYGWKILQYPVVFTENELAKLQAAEFLY